MAASSANVASIDAVRTVKGALRQFEADLTNALVTLELEARRPMEWLEHDRSQYWPRELRRASDWVAEARLAMQRCELTIDADHRKTCYDERKQLEKAKRRLELSEEKIQAVRRWRLEVRKEVEEFEVHVAKLKRYLETDFQRAIAALERMAAALDRYTQTGSPAAGERASQGATSSADSTSSTTPEAGG